MERSRNATIKKVSEDFTKFKFNTSISSLMILMNAAEKYASSKSPSENQAVIINGVINSVILLLSPMAPHVCEEMWQKIGEKEESIVKVPWPEYDAKSMETEYVQVVVQVNGKLRGKFEVPAESTQEQVKEIFLADDKIKKFIEGKPIKKFIYVPGKIANFVV